MMGGRAGDQVGTLESGPRWGLRRRQTQYLLGDFWNREWGIFREGFHVGSPQRDLDLLLNGEQKWEWSKKSGGKEK